MTRKIFITGTGTDVGKTIVTRAVVRALVNRGVRLNAVKPVESGVPMANGKLSPLDGSALLLAAKSEKSIAETCRYMFQTPVSPHLAARLENAKIDETEIYSFLESAASDCDILFAEGAGGLLVPLNDNILYGDLIARAKAELLIVAPNILGTINSTLLTIDAARSRQIPVLGIILNKGENDSLQNADAISHFGNLPILGTFPIIDQLDDDEKLARAAEQHLNLEVFLSGALHTC